MTYPTFSEVMEWWRFWVFLTVCLMLLIMRRQSIRTEERRAAQKLEHEERLAQLGHFPTPAKDKDEDEDEDDEDEDADDDDEGESPEERLVRLINRVKPCTQYDDIGPDVPPSCARAEVDVHGYVRLILTRPPIKTINPIK